MEFSEVVRRRRMIRDYDPSPLPSEQLTRIVGNALRAPSAGNSQGWAFLLLEDRADVDLFWETTSPDPEADNRWLRGMRRAPHIVVPLANKDAYLDRYAEPDKGWADRDEARWPIPYWYTDAAMAALLMLLTATDEGLGACFFGIPGERHDQFRTAFDVPAAYTPIGAVSLGRRTTQTGSPGSKDRTRSDAVHRGRFRTFEQTDGQTDG